MRLYRQTPIVQQIVHRGAGPAPAVEGGPVGPARPLEVTNLYLTLPQLARLLAIELSRESALDAFLLAAGMCQLVDDYLAPDMLSLRRVAAVLIKHGGGPGQTLAPLVKGSADGLDATAAALPARRRVRRLQGVLALGLEELAERVVAPGAPTGSIAALARACERLGAPGARLPRALSEDVVRLPACFRSFDQHPDDLGALAQRFAATHPDRRQPIALLGVRTSGSYLAPLLGAYLRREGFDEVVVRTLRPGRRQSRAERDALHDLARRGGIAVLCDDPPVSGSSLAAVAADLERAGVPPERIVIALALFGDGAELPPALTPYGSVVLPFAEWSIHRRLDEAGVREAVDRLAGPGRRVSALTKTATGTPRGGRGHLKATYRLELEDTATGERAVEDVSVEGVGLGYFGNHAVAVANPLREYLPRVLGVEDGLLYRQWLPDDACAERLESLDPAVTAGRIAEYVATRSTALPLEDDVALRLGGQYPAWEAASTVISRSFGRAWPVGRALLTDRAVRRLLPVAHPSDIDGRADLSRWFLDREHDRLVKVDWDQGSTWNLGLGCSDPVFDVARLAAASADPSLGDALRHAFEARTGEPIEEERLLLYRLAQFAAPGEADHETRRARKRSAVRALQAYFRRIYFADLPAGDGPLCGIDIDGVLESDHLGVPALTPVSALALRTLIAHGYRPLVVTGRSLIDVRERCEAYGLVGGVAEYGAVAHVAASGSVRDLRGVDGAAIASLLAELRAREGVLIDEDYTYAIRAYVRDARGRRGPLSPEAISEARRAAGVGEDRVRAIRGDAQTDFVAASTDKSGGVIALAAELGEPAPVRLALAVGDTRSDAPMLDLAERACAPAHARDALGGYTIMRAPYQKGFAEAVSRLIGHECGGCERCRLERPSAERRLMLGLLGLREAGMRGVPVRAMRAGLRWPG